jgi:hypothetical protein
MIKPRTICDWYQTLNIASFFMLTLYCVLSLLFTCQNFDKNMICYELINQEILYLIIS